MERLAIRDVDGNEISIDGGAIKRFVSSIHGQVLLAGDPGYEDTRKVWNAMIDRRPAVIVRCADADDVVACVQLAARHRLLTAVRGGGHNVAGNAVNDGGLVIDLSGMRHVVVHKERMTATVQGGATLGDVDLETQNFGLATPLGVVPRTGVAGLALHGGLGWLLRRFGTTADNIVGAEVVTADGTLLTVNENEYMDLLWALRGGGGNFGVVTSFDLRLHAVGRVWAGLLMYALGDLPELLPKFEEFMSTAPDELTANLQLWPAPSLPSVPKDMVDKPSVIVTACYSSPLEKAEAVLSPLRTMGTLIADMSMPLKYLEMQDLGSTLGSEDDGASRHYWKSLFLDEINAEAVRSLMSAAESRPSPLSTITVYYLGGAYSRVGAEHAAFDNREQRYLVSLEADWNEAADDEKNIAWARKWFDVLRKNAQARVYLNFPGMAEEESMAEDSFAENLARLREIKAKYDPTNLFRGRLSVRPSGT